MRSPTLVGPGFPFDHPFVFNLIVSGGGQHQAMGNSP
jgi:hypothetical protein